jgi:RNA polymerase sigma-70 factor, ECF subfamily
MRRPIIAETPEERRFLGVFGHLTTVTAYAQRRGSPDPEAIAAEVMTIAWRRLQDVPVRDPLPWLLVTARNLVLAQLRAVARREAAGRAHGSAVDPYVENSGLSLELEAALRQLAPTDREALLLIAWEGLSPAQAARVLGMTPVAFRVRLHRARHRCALLLERIEISSVTHTEVP